MARKVLFISLLLVSMFSLAQADTTNKAAVAEYNAQVGFNDSIDRLADDFIEAYLVIAQPSATIYSTLGHACLRMRCKTFGLDYMFSYESEDAQNKVMAFLSGNLKMGMFTVSPEEYMSSYRESQRGVIQYKLNLPPDVEIKLWEILDQEIMKGAYLPYDYLKRGCTYSIVHFLNKALVGHQLTYGPWPEKYRMTRREFVSSNLENYPWADCIFGLVVGTEADKKVSDPQKIVIPSDLPEVLKNAKIDGVDVITDVPQILVEDYPLTSKRWFTPFLFAIFVLALVVIAFWLPRPYNIIIDSTFMVFVTVIGLFLSYMLFCSSLPNTSWNWLIIAFNPLPAICWKWRQYWVVPYIFILVIWIIAMIAYPHVLVNDAYLILAGSEIVLLMKHSRWQDIFKKYKQNKLS